MGEIDEPVNVGIGVCLKATLKFVRPDGGLVGLALVDGFRVYVVTARTAECAGQHAVILGEVGVNTSQLGQDWKVVDVVDVFLRNTAAEHEGGVCL